MVVLFTTCFAHGHSPGPFNTVSIPLRIPSSASANCSVINNTMNYDTSITFTSSRLTHNIMHTVGTVFWDRLHHLSALWEPSTPYQPPQYLRAICRSYCSPAITGICTSTIVSIIVC
jgi:hypothetical protein